jgi:hypothetical protein
MLLVSTGIFVAVVAARAIRNRKSTSNAAALLLGGSFTLSYPLFLLIHNTFVSPAVELDARLLMPVYVFANLLAVIAVYRFAELRRDKLLWRSFLIVVLLLAGVNLSFAVPYLIQRHQNGSGYASRQWTDSETIGYLKRANERRIIYSNGVDAVAFLTRQDAVRLPAKIDPVSWQVNRDFERQMAVLTSDVMQNHAVIVLFDKVDWRYYLPRREELEDTYNLPVMLRLQDGIVYGLP